MNKDRFKVLFKEKLDYMYSTMEKKNSDYSWGDKVKNPFQNFELVEQLWITTTSKGILVRICDKMSRISSLMDNDAKVADESQIDTCIDWANYFLILALRLIDEKEKREATTRDNSEPIRGRNCIEWSTPWF